MTLYVFDSLKRINSYTRSFGNRSLITLFDALKITCTLHMHIRSFSSFMYRLLSVGDCDLLKDSFLLNSTLQAKTVSPLSFYLFLHKAMWSGRPTQ